ncbi:MAG TPA: hypothetical protein VHQ24_16185 [Lachnospiraceae bacterium]|nr:hypothetical protein [Lachnospiraceae bacterium]
MEEEKKKTHLRPFDTTLIDDLSMYDKMPYKSSYDFCNKSTIGLRSGNLLKYYRVKENEPYIFKPKEFNIYQNISTGHLNEELPRHEEFTPDQDGLTPEQLESLLEDNDLN